MILGFEERPLYLFDPQLEWEAPDERHADWWAMALSQALAGQAGVPFAPILPGGAPGRSWSPATTIRPISKKFEEQPQELGDLPITYFLHPLTRHDRASMARLFAGHRVDLGIQPRHVARGVAAVHLGSCGAHQDERRPRHHRPQSASAKHRPHARNAPRRAGGSREWFSGVDRARMPRMVRAA